MVERRIKVTLEVGADGAVKVLEQTGAAAGGAADQFDKLGKSASTNEKAIKDAGLTLTAFGVGGAAALIASGKAAVDWESAWAGVTKTVDGSAQQLADLEDGLRSMARELPATHSEIAGVAEAAGQLGVATEDVETFTRTMIDLGETTNLTSEEAATNIAQMANVMGTGADDIERLGSTLVALGNNSATTERHILEMSQRMSGAAAIVGLTEAEVMALAATTASMGIEVEAGGTAISRVFIDMSKAAQQGGDDLDAFARTAGMSAQEFARAFAEDPAQAFAAFIAGLDGIQQSGGDVFTTLDELGLADVRVSRALLGMAASGDLLTDSLELSADAWSKNTALADEAAQRYATTASQMAMARNNVKDAAISFGEVLLPAVVGASNAVAGFAGWLADLPPEAQSAAVGVGAITTATSLLMGSALLAIPKLKAMHATLVTIQATAPGTALALKSVALAAGGLAALVVLAEANEWINGFVSRNDDLEQTAEVLTRVADAADFADEKVKWMTRSSLFNTEEWVSGADALERFATSAQIAFGDTLEDKLGRLQNSGSFDRFVEDAKGYDTALAQLASSGNADEAAAKFEMFWDTVKDKDGVTLEEVMRAFPQYEEAMRSLGAATQETLDAATSWDMATFPDLAPQMTDNARAQAAAAEATRDNSDATDELAEAYNELLNDLGAGSSEFVSITGALDATQAKTQEWAQGQADATATVEDTWEDFYDGHSVKLDEYLAELQSMVDAQTNWQSNMTSLVGRVSTETLEELARLGPEAAPLVAALTDATADELAEFERNFGASGKRAGENFGEELLGAQGVVNIAAGTLGQGAAAKIAEELRNGEMTAAEAVLAYNLKAELEVLADTDPAAAAVLEQVEAIEARETYLTVNGDLGPAEEEVEDFVFAVDRTIATPTIHADTGPGAESVADFQYDTNRKSATLMIYANTSDIYDAVGNAMYWIRSQRPVLRVGMNNLALAGGGPVALASGGPVRGPGGPTEDRVPAYNRDTGTQYALSNDEHVLTAAEVFALGGHAEVYRMRKAMLAGEVRYDVGGEVGTPRRERFGAMRYTTPAPQAFDYDRLAAALTRPNVQMPVTVMERFDANEAAAAIAWAVH